ncbi:MAG TPA: hypothetical protein VMY38_06570, partial [Gemmatimonadaceae bacterium]|nr:hypothetical protein [Gemmatimonadaceae bacterium]
MSRQYRSVRGRCVVSVFLLAACGGQGAEAAAAQPSRSPEAAVTRELTRIRARTDSIDAIF